jgi:hypothetical protein
MVEGQGPKFSHYQRPAEGVASTGEKTVTVQEKKSEGSAWKSFLSLFLFFGVLYGLSQLTSMMEESMSKSMPGSKDEHATDPFDRIFGSEFSTKFKNNTRNKGVIKKEAEMKKKWDAAKQNFRKRGTTSTVKEICEYLSGDREIIILMQKFAANDIEEGMRYLKNSKIDIRRIFPLAFQGYTFREIIGEAHEGRNISRLRLASAYILDCIMTNQEPSQSTEITATVK